MHTARRTSRSAPDLKPSHAPGNPVPCACVNKTIVNNKNFRLLGNCPANGSLTASKFKVMEWVPLKPIYKQGNASPSAEQTVFSWLSRAGFQLEQLRRSVEPPVNEYFYFHPSRYIQIHMVEDPETGLARFFIFYPGGQTLVAPGIPELQATIAAG